LAGGLGAYPPIASELGLRRLSPPNDERGDHCGIVTFGKLVNISNAAGRHKLAAFFFCGLHSMDSVQDALKLGWKYHQAGNLVMAEQCYRRTLQDHPEHGNALHLLGRLKYARATLTRRFSSYGRP
jgi:hypothetical protein